MLPKKEHPKEKTKLHPRNKHRERYDFKELIKSCPELEQYVELNDYNDESIDFFDAEAVKTLNKALLKHFYAVNYWEIPQNYLCPPIPGRADYIHYAADLLGNLNNGKIPTGEKITCLDIGVGANCVYPIIGNKEYGWNFIGTEIDSVAVDSANKIIDMNAQLKEKIEIRLQQNPKDILYGVLKKDERIDISFCNPPFHASLEEAQAGTLRKLSNLKGKKITTASLNFGGKNNELWCKGGEIGFVRDMIRQSKQFSESVFWFTTSISKQSNLNAIYQELEKANAIEVKTIPMGQGNKTSRIVAWTFKTKEEQQKWVKEKW
ncbi:23S rRNA (adenine(1618)-N(6))-methyltransferase RlmF [Sediminibacterium sp.]|uniref:23S rRNA (adenine(1618)-N(6))-methyltransferase RlmF n=1 Tax=Sediminibacterium sp. TaxID=1917865 RepID=UPI0027345A41|nr:23S rRNA (adenine(1618)-N(6))-methyltransferase RlmF [Sediminibacterium sp.]MDP3567653.1 23S rRNA (adenine(1618)-N(6))-methyltransferase RlmF [Sediminibacterium sp.]